MKTNIKTALLIAMLLVTVIVLVGCSQADRVSHNISKEADAFNVIRRIAVINARTDKPLFELVGAFSISNNSSRELVVTCQTGPNEFKKHMIYLNDFTMYVIEDVSGANASPYKYEVNFLPEMIWPITITSSY